MLQPRAQHDELFLRSRLRSRSDRTSSVLPQPWVRRHCGGVFLACFLLAPLQDAHADLALAQASGCTVCHAVDHQIVGPAYQDVASKYRDDPDAVAKLTTKVKSGGSGNWGQIPMPPNVGVSDENIEALVRWVLSL